MKTLVSICPKCVILTNLTLGPSWGLNIWGINNFLGSTFFGGQHFCQGQHFLGVNILLGSTFFPLFERGSYGSRPFITFK
jgi:hypothetical protein